MSALAESARIGINSLCRDLRAQRVQARTIEHVRELLTSRETRINDSYAHIVQLEAQLGRLQKPSAEVVEAAARALCVIAQRVADTWTTEEIMAHSGDKLRRDAVEMLRAAYKASAPEVTPDV